ncbi:hypothetical protein WG66_008773 [Moniliophthora roreri]|nr:hypothetical protein WG66_008773 [Moniliophthora roreri]
MALNSLAPPALVALELLRRCQTLLNGSKCPALSGRLEVYCERVKRTYLVRTFTKHTVKQPIAYNTEDEE